jgi:hypothetical protein
VITKSAPDTKKPSTEDQMADLRAVLEKLASAGNQGQLTIGVNRLQSEKLATTIGNTPASVGASPSAPATSDATTNATKFKHKLLFLTYDSGDNPLPLLNWCEQFFRV